MTRFAYGTAVRKYATLDAAAEAAIERHSHYHTDAPGWLLRAEPVRYAAIAPYANPVSGEGEWYTTDAQIELFAFPVLRWTPYGATLREIWSGARHKWVDLRPGAKQWASRTAAEAVQQLADRRERQIWVLKHKLARAEAEIGLAQRTLNPSEQLFPIL